MERDNHARGTRGMLNKTFVEYATLSKGASSFA